jgi:Raf kinase inhibitor-like YbhB/YbcL family protein
MPMLEILTVTSPSFQNNGSIPFRHCYDGANISPAISIKGVPSEAKCLALIMEDQQTMGTFDHWIMWNIPITDTIEENTSPGIVGLNSNKERLYTGPNPPSGEHHYHFKIYALDTLLDIPEMSTKQDLERAMRNHILASGTITGVYKKEDPNRNISAQQR